MLLGNQKRNKPIINIMTALKVVEVLAQKKKLLSLPKAFGEAFSEEAN